MGRGSGDLGRRTEDPRKALHDLAISLARHPDIIEFSRSLVAGARRGRLARIAAVYTFVAHLVDVPPPEPGDCRDGVDTLLMLAGEQEGPAVILSALLQALGERAPLRHAPGFAFVGVELDLEDVARLPPHAVLLSRRGRCFLPLDARGTGHPLGFLPRTIRRVLGGSTA